MADITFVQSVKELLFLVVLVIILGFIIGAVIIGSIIGLLIFAGLLMIYTLTFMTLGFLSPGLVVTYPLGIIRPILIISVILGSLIETHSMNKKISLYDLQIFSLQKFISY